MERNVIRHGVIVIVNRNRNHNRLQRRGGQLAPRGPHVARHSVFSGPRKHSGKTWNFEFPRTYHSNCYQANL